MSNQLQQTRYDQLIRRAGGLIGGGSKVSSVIPELFPVLELERTTPELLALSGWRLGWQSTECPALIGFNNVSQIFNPSNSGMIIAITQVGLRVNVASALVQMEIVDTALVTAAVNGLFRDARFGVPRNTVAEFRSNDGVVVGGGLRWLVSTAQEIIRDDNGLVILTPGTGLSIGTVTTNITMTSNYFWRERVAETSELSFP